MTTGITKFEIIKDVPNRKMTIRKDFNATPEQVWTAWTESEYLDQWWAPQPWKAETKSMDFREGGQWLYAMVGPDDTRHWARVDFLAIDPGKSFTAMDMFSDENGNPAPGMPQMKWRNTFNATPEGTQVIVEINFDKEADLKTIVEMGFESGFTAGLSQLERLLSTKFNTVLQ